MPESLYSEFGPYKCLTTAPQTCSFKLSEERRLRVFGNRMVKTFGPQRGEVTGELRILHNEELYDLYCSPHIIRVINSRRMRWALHIERMGDRRGAY